MKLEKNWNYLFYQLISDSNRLRRNSKPITRLGLAKLLVISSLRRGHGSVDGSHGAAEIANIETRDDVWHHQRGIRIRNGAGTRGTKKWLDSPPTATFDLVPNQPRAAILLPFKSGPLRSRPRSTMATDSSDISISNMTSRRGRMYTRGSRARAQRSIVDVRVCDPRFSTATELRLLLFNREGTTHATHVDRSIHLSVLFLPLRPSGFERWRVSRFRRRESCFESSRQSYDMMFNILISLIRIMYVPFNKHKWVNELNIGWINKCKNTNSVG